MYHDDMYDLYERRPVGKVGDIYLYVIEKGDNLWQISRTMNSNVDWIRAMNNLEPNSILQPGQQILVPVLTRRPTQPPYREQPINYDMYF